MLKIFQFVMKITNSIKVITLANGCRIEDPEAIKQEAVAHFQNVLCSDGPSNVHDVYLDNLDGFAWSPQHLDTLNSMITHEEIKKAMFSMNDSKAPGQMVSHHYFSRKRGVLLVVM